MSIPDHNSGAPREAYASRDFIVISLAAVDIVGWEAAAVFQRIAYRAERTGAWTATHAMIQEETRLSEHKVKQALTLLRDQGWLTSTRADRFDPTQTWTPIWEPDSPPHVTEPDTVTVTEDSSVTLFTQTVETTPLQSPPVDAGFEEFWSRYPRKVGKQAAAKAYATARKRGVSHDHIMTGLRHQWQFLAAEKPRGFCPHPSTWLNQGRWEDEAPTPRMMNGRGNQYVSVVQADATAALGILGIDRRELGS